MRVMVTGGAGFIGSHTTDKLLDDGHSVVVLDNLSTGFRENVNERATLSEVDITNEEEVRRAVEVFRPEIVVHLAAQMDVRVSVRLPTLDASINIIGSLNVLRAAVDSGVKKIVYSSTGGAVYGEPDVTPVPEEHPIRPISPYGISKHTVEHYLFMYEKQYGLDYTVLRYPNVFGPRQNPDGEAGVIAIFGRQLLTGVACRIFGDGEQKRDYVFVEDVVAANMAALTKGNGDILNIGSGVGTTVNDVYRTIAQVLGVRRAPIYESPRVGEVRSICLDATSAHSKLGWRARVDLEEGVRQTMIYLKSVRHLDGV